jgi:endonuclease YncB( thermonuclease family)
MNREVQMQKRPWMKGLNVILSTSLFIFLFAFGAGAMAEESSCTHSAKAFHCVNYIRNYDGDTLTVRIPSVHPLLGKDISVRILGIDSPEIRSDDPCERQSAFKAKEALKAILKKAKRIDLTSIGRDKYFRVLAEVDVDGVNVAEQMLKEGYAVPYDGGHRPVVNWCQR